MQSDPVLPPPPNHPHPPTSEATGMDATATIASRLLGLNRTTPRKFSHNHLFDDPDELPSPDTGDIKNKMKSAYQPPKRKTNVVSSGQTDNIQKQTTGPRLTPDHTVFDSLTGTHRRHAGPIQQDKTKVPVSTMKHQLNANVEFNKLPGTTLLTTTSKLEQKRQLIHSVSSVRLAVPSSVGSDVSRSVPSSPQTSPQLQRKESWLGHMMGLYSHISTQGSVINSDKLSTIFTSPPASTTATTTPTTPSSMSIFRGLTGQKSRHEPCASCAGTSMDERDSDPLYKEQAKVRRERVERVKEAYPPPKQVEFYHQSTDGIYVQDQPKDMQPKSRRKCSITRKDMNVNAPVFM